MNFKTRIRYFGLFFIPMLLLSLLINVVYSLQVDQYVTLHWISVVGLGVALAALLTWRETRTKKES